MICWLKIQLIQLINKDAIIHRKDGITILFNRMAMTHLGAGTLAMAIVDEVRNIKFNSLCGSVECLPLVMSTLSKIPYCRGFCVDPNEYDIWGAIYAGDSVIILVDVADTAEPILELAKMIEKFYHCEIKLILAVIDLEKGAVTVRESGYAFTSLLTISDLNRSSDPVYE